MGIRILLKPPLTFFYSSETEITKALIVVKGIINEINTF